MKFSNFKGTSWCSCNIYLYMWSEKIVISDIDGTITRSDVLGHVIPAIGGQWAHAGVAELYTRIKDNGYLISFSICYYFFEYNIVFFESQIEIGIYGLMQKS